MLDCENKLTKKHWLDTISKQIDREINCRRASGGANWALLGLVAYFIYQGITNWLPSFYAESNLFPFLLFSSIFINLGAMTSLIYLYFFKFSNGKETAKILPKFEEMNKGILLSSLSFFSLSAFVLNLLSTYLFYLENGPLLGGSILSIFWLYYILQFVFLGYSFMNGKKPSWVSASFLLAENPAAEVVQTKSKRILFYIFSGTTLFIFFSKLPPVIDENIANMISFSAQFCLLHFVALFSMLRFSAVDKEALLQELEKKILLDKISVDEIKGEYEMALSFAEKFEKPSCENEASTDEADDEKNND